MPVPEKETSLPLLLFSSEPADLITATTLGHQQRITLSTSGAASPCERQRGHDPDVLVGLKSERRRSGAASA